MRLILMKAMALARDRRWLINAAALCGAIVASAWLSPGSATSAQHYPLVLLWREANNKQLPDYPRSSIAAGHQGLAVMELEIRADGTVREFSVLQAPDSAISNSMAAYVRGFRLGPSRFGRIPLRRGKLLYYFLLARGEARVFELNDLNQKTELLQELRDSGGHR